MIRSLRPVVAVLGTALLLVPGLARAERPLALETRAGASFSRFLEDPGAEQKTGFVGSVAFHLGLTERLTLQTELGYAMKGTSYGSYTDPIIGESVYPGTFEMIYALDYLELPVLLRARLANGVVRPHLIAGPVVGWKAVEKFRLHGTDEYAGKGIAMQTFDLGVAGGLGFEFGAPERCVTLEVRYTRGFTDVLKPEYEGKVLNSDVRVALGWKADWTPGLTMH